MHLPDKALTGDIIGAAIEVHRHLGPGFLESVYGNALAIELRARSIGFERELAVPIFYRGAEVGLHRLDLFVAGRMVVELKAVKELVDMHYCVMRSYLHAVKCPYGLILNFARSTLGVKRVFKR